MALQALHQGVNLTAATTGKRKHSGEPADDDAITTKRQRDSSSSNLTTTTSTNPPPTSLSAQPLQTLIAELSPNYDIKTLSVLSSTSICKRVDSVISHLGRISAWDASVLPGVVLLYARAASANKLITIAETVRRRVHEGEQKWYQYNRLYEMEWAAAAATAKQPQPQPPDHKMETMVEDTVMAIEGGEGNDSGDDDDFEVMATPQQQQTVFERAVHGEGKAKQMAHIIIFLSRIPIPKLGAKENFAVQSNEEYVNYVQRKKSGLAA